MRLLQVKPNLYAGPEEPGGRRVAKGKKQRKKERALNMFPAVLLGVPQYGSEKPGSMQTRYSGAAKDLGPYSRGHGDRAPKDSHPELKPNLTDLRHSRR